MSDSPSTPTPTITIRKNGNLLVTGDVILMDHEGTIIDPPKRPFALCRCGSSEKKPYCDGAHARVGFCATAAEVIAE